MQKTTLGGLVAGLIVLTGASAAHAVDYYVAIGGSDASAGTTTAPWATLQYAANRVNAGDTVHVRDGSYVGFNATRSGTAAAVVRFIGDGANVRISTRNAATPDGINVEGADYVIIDNFIINGLPRAGVRCAVSNHVTIRRIRADLNARWGIFTGCCPDAIIEDNVTSRSMIEHGIYFSNSADRPIIRRNISFANRANGIHMNGDASIVCGSGMVSDGVISNAVIERNVIYGNGAGGGSGINCDGVSNSVIRNNLIYDSLASGISLYQIDAATGSRNNLVVNNTIIQSSTGRWAVNIIGGSTGNTLRNNILFTNHAFRGAIVIDASSRTGFTSDYNLLTPRMSADGDATILNLAQWQALGFDRNSMASTAAANFVNVATNDYHLRAGVPAIDRGEAARAPADDLEGMPRPSGTLPDIGAYEYRGVVLADSGTPTDTGGGLVDSGPRDTGAPDAGMLADAGTADSGTPTDSGPADTGTLADSGIGIDMGTPGDTGAALDSGSLADTAAAIDVPVARDTGTAADAVSADGNRADASLSDGPRGDVGAEGTTMSAGCRCGVLGFTPRRGMGAYAGLALGLAVLQRRRRVRGRGVKAC